MQLGKHICVEKPLAHNVWQLRTLRKAAKKYNVISQMANQGHATMGIRYVKEWYDAGVLGNVREVLAWFDGPEFNERGYFLKPDSYPPKGETIPEGIDWDLWLGQQLIVHIAGSICHVSGEAGMNWEMESLEIGLAILSMLLFGHLT